MCGRYGVQEEDGEREVFPTQRARVRCADGLREMTWGYPAASKKGVLINARAETAAQKRLFAQGLRDGRCIVEGSCFYEWQRAQDGQRKEKYRVARSDGQPLCMAALHDGKGRFVILTQTADFQIAPLHDRMPVLLHTPELESLWLQSEEMAQTVLESLPAPPLTLAKAEPMP